MSEATEGKPRATRKQRFARFVAKLALLTVTATWVVQECFGETEWWSAYFTFAPCVVFLALPAVALPLAVLCLDKSAFWWALGAVLLWVVALGQPALGLQRPQASGATVRVVTWNLHDELQSIDEVRDVLDELAPDIVFLQEADARQFEDCMPGAAQARAGSCLLLTTGEITESEALGRDDSTAWRQPLAATVRLPQGEVTVLDAHLYSFQLGAALKHPSRARAKRLTAKAVEMRAEQVEVLLGWLEEQTGPIIVGGDFNTPPRGKLYGKIRKHLTDSFAAVGRGFGWSFPHRIPVLRIDYVFTSKDLTPLTCKVLDTGPSDHRPVVADIQLQ